MLQGISFYQLRLRASFECIFIILSQTIMDLTLRWSRYECFFSFDCFHFKSCNEVCMRFSEYFGMKVCYSTLKLKEHVFLCLAEIFFFRNSELLKITLQFHKNCQNIFQNDAVFLTNIHIRLVFHSCDEKFLSLSNDPRKILKLSKLRKWWRFFWKFWK